MFPTEPVPEKLGAYKVIRRLNGAGSVDVYLGRMEGPMGFQRVCALKLVPHSMEGDARLAEELAREAAISARLNHPAIVRMFDFFEHERRLVLVLEHVDGADLERLAQHLARRKQRLGDNAIWYVAHQLAGALAHAHAATDESGKPTPVLHRNLNLENVLVAWDGQVRLGGFGLGKILGRTEDTVVGTVKGTPGFMAPEQARGERATTRSDVYALGVILWSLLTGRTPPVESRPEPLSTLRDDLPRELVAAIEAAMEPSADKRKITAAEIEQWLAKVTKVESGRSELREKILLLRSNRGEASGGESMRPTRGPTQPRRRLSLRAVKSAGGGTPTAPPPARSSLRPPKPSSFPPPPRSVPPSRSAAPPSRQPDPLLESAPPRRMRAPSSRVDPRAEPVDLASPEPPQRPRAALRTMLGGLEAPAATFDASAPAAPIAAIPPAPLRSEPAPSLAPKLEEAPPAATSAATEVIGPDPMSRAPAPADAVTPFAYAIAPPTPPPIAPPSSLGDAPASGPSPLEQTARRAAAPGVTLLSAPKRTGALSPLQSLLVVVASATVVVLVGIWIVERRDGSTSATAATDATATASVATAAPSAAVVTGAPKHSASARAPSASAPSATIAPPKATAVAVAGTAPETLPATPPAGYGYLTVSAPSKLNVYVNGNVGGTTNEQLKVVCGRFFVRVGEQPEGERFPTFHGPGMTVLVPCQGSITVTMNGH